MFTRTPRPLELLVLISCFSGLWILVTIFGPPSLSEHSRMFAGRTEHTPNIKDHVATSEEHPIKAIIRRAGAEFEDLLARQSKTFETAASVYLDRYHRHPPPGFEMWYEYAVIHDSLIIDEFDIINETLAPFWSMSGAEVKRRMEVIRDDGFAIQHCDFTNGQLADDCNSLNHQIMQWLNDTDTLSHLPEVNMLVNVLDEPRVLPGSKVDESDETDLWSDRSHSHVWDQVTAPCRFGLDPEVSLADAADSARHVPGLRFSTGGFDTLDLCQHPEFKDMHGLWGSPFNLHTTSLAVPILSASVLSTMGDIPIPAAAYTSGAYMYDELEDMPWDNKTVGLYWAGKTTGSIQGVADQDWKQHHRQRFVRLANSLDSESHIYLETADHGKTWEQHNSIVMNGPLYNVYFTEVVQCKDDATKAAILKVFDMHEPDPRSEAFKYTLNFDLDGNGHSGRFYRLLNSQSLPLKQTVLREWHDERLKPWLHYVPVSLGMEELPEVVRYLADEEEGRQAAAMMAEMGRQWSLRALRPVDQAIYIYRLMLELARLQDPARLAY